MNRIQKTTPLRTVFTDYLRSLDPAGSPPDSETFEKLWESLRGVLESELRKRGLWSCSPTYLGIYGFSKWPARGSGQYRMESNSEVGSKDALDELAANCYEFVFLRRSRSLRAQLQIKDNVDGLVFLSLRNFLYETQRRHDPLGYRIFAILNKALSQCLQTKVLHLVSGGPKIANDTLLSFDLASESLAERSGNLGEIVCRWNDELLPDLVTARGREQETLIQRLQDLLATLPHHGIDSFHFRDLVDPLKADVRSRWVELLEEEAGERAFEGAGDESSRPIPVVPPETVVEERDSFEKLVRCVSQELDQLDSSASTRKHLRALWHFLRSLAGQEGNSPEGRPETIPDEVLRGNRLSRRKLSRLLGIPRDRFPELFSTISSLVGQCQVATSRSRGVSPRGPIRVRPSIGRKNLMDIRDLHRDLRRRTGEVLRRDASLEDSRFRQRDPKPLRPGDLFLLPSMEGNGLEWAVLSTSTEENRETPSGFPERVLVVPADTVPLIGTGDLEATDEANGAPLGPLNLRCKFGVWAKAASFDPAWKTGALDQETLDLALKYQRAAKAGTLQSSSLEQEVDCDPEYETWKLNLASARGSLEISSDATPTRSPWWSGGVSLPLGLAASILFMVALGLGGGLASERGKTNALEAELSTLASQQHILANRLEDSNRHQLELSKRIDQGKDELAEQELAFDRERRLFRKKLATQKQAARAPVVNWPIKHLQEKRPERGPPKTLEKLSVPADSPAYALHFSLPTMDSGDKVYRLDISPLADRQKGTLQSGTITLSLPDLKRASNDSTTSVLLRRTEIPAGEYQLRLFHQEDGSQEKPVKQFFLELILE
ncbi:MAG: hypothetical protein K0U98_09215 [Deltaproteobacteria bacterium]|nr:hypothetical protein [Deltaproteobacteria bacterium]